MRRKPSSYLESAWPILTKAGPRRTSSSRMAAARRTLRGLRSRGDDHLHGGGGRDHRHTCARWGARACGLRSGWRLTCTVVQARAPRCPPHEREPPNPPTRPPTCPGPLPPRRPPRCRRPARAAAAGRPPPPAWAPAGRRGRKSATEGTPGLRVRSAWAEGSHAASGRPSKPSIGAHLPAQVLKCSPP